MKTPPTVSAQPHLGKWEIEIIAEERPSDPIGRIGRIGRTHSRPPVRQTRLKWEKNRDFYEKRVLLKEI